MYASLYRRIPDTSFRYVLETTNSLKVFRDIQTCIAPLLLRLSPDCSRGPSVTYHEVHPCRNQSAKNITIARIGGFCSSVPLVHAARFPLIKRVISSPSTRHQQRCILCSVFPSTAPQRSEPYNRGRSYTTVSRNLPFNPVRTERSPFRHSHVSH